MREAIAANTIYAPATAVGRGAIAIVRISGSDAGPALQALTGQLPRPRMATRARVWQPENGEGIDDAVSLWFPGPNSVTGEDLAELHLHGSRAVLAAVMAALRRRGQRLAEPREFPRPAFANGKLDPTHTQAIAHLAARASAAPRR